MTELTAQGLSRADADSRLRIEQEDAAAETRREIAELSVQGLSGQEIAAAVSGLVLETSSPVTITPMSSSTDVVFGEQGLYYDYHCDCHHVYFYWNSINDLENGRDVVGMFVNESVSNYGATVAMCDRAPDPDTCQYYRTNWEDPNGVALDFESEKGEYGSINWSVRNYTDGPGPCQMYMYYLHAWENTEVTGVSIAADGMSVSFGTVTRTWRKQESSWVGRDTNC